MHPIRAAHPPHSPLAMALTPAGGLPVRAVCITLLESLLPPPPRHPEVGDGAMMS